MQLYDKNIPLGQDEILCLRNRALYVEKRVDYDKKCWLTRFFTRGRYDQTKILSILNAFAKHSVET